MYFGSSIKTTPCMFFYETAQKLYLVCQLFTVIFDTDLSLFRVSSDYETLSQQQQNSSTFAKNHLPMPAPLTRTPSDSSINVISKNSMLPQIDKISSTNNPGLPRVPSQPNMQRSTNQKPEAQRLPSNPSKLPSNQLPEAPSQLPSNRSERSSSNPVDLSENDNDLMVFKMEDEEEYLSLESFDPLYNLSETFDSAGLFTNPIDKFKRHETPNPFPMVNAVSTQKLLEASGGVEKESNAAKHYNTINVEDLEKELEIKGKRTE